MSLIRNINRMVGSREFQLLDASTSRSGIFSIIGKETNENVHKRMLAWLLNPECDHGLGAQSIARLLAIAKLTHEELGLPNHPNFSLPEVAKSESDNFNFHYTDKDKRHSCLKPNLSKDTTLGEPSEIKISTPSFTPKGGYLDVFADFRHGSKRSLIVIEIKVDSKEHTNQLERYGDWLAGTEAPDELTTNAGSRVAIFLTRDEPQMKGDAGWPTDDRWIPISWQMIHDELILPAIRSPKLTRPGLSKLEQWSEALQDIEVAIGEDERHWASIILQGHGKDLAEFKVATQDEQSLPKRCTLNLLVNHGSIPLGATVRFKNTSGHTVNLAGTIDRGDRIGIEINGEVITNLREALRLAIDSYQPTWLDKILIVDTDGGERSLLDHWGIFIADFEKNLPKITKSERAYCKAIQLKHEKTISLIDRVSGEQ